MSDNVTPLTIPRVKKLQYILLSGNRADESRVPYHDSAYELWQRSWQKTFEDLKSEHKLRAEDFTRHDLVAGLFYQGKAIGLLLHTIYDLELEAVRNQAYLATFPPEILEKVREEGTRQVLSMEYLTLDPAWGRRAIGIPLVEVIVGLSAKIAMTSNLRTIQVARIDRGIHEILYGYGARCLVKNLTLHNVAVDLVSLDAKDVHFNNDEKIRHWIEYFWVRRVDSIDFLTQPSAVRARIA